MLCTIYFQVVWIVNEKKRCERETVQTWQIGVSKQNIFECSMHCSSYILVSLNIFQIKSWKKVKYLFWNFNCTVWLNCYYLWNNKYAMKFKGGDFSSVQFSSVAQSCPTLCTPWTAAHQASLSITNSQSSLKFTSIELVIPSSHLILCHPLFLLPQSHQASESFPMTQLFAWGGQSPGVSALASFLPKNTQGWSPLKWTGWISLQSKGLSRVFSNTTVQKPQFFSTLLSLQSNSHIHTWLLEKP